MASIFLPTTNSARSEKPPFSPLNSSKTRDSLQFSQTQFPKLQEQKRNRTNTTLHQTNHSYYDYISSLCKDGYLEQAISVLNEIEMKGLFIGPEIYGELLQGCVYQRGLFQGQQIHARIVKNGVFFTRNEFLETKLVIFYAKCDSEKMGFELFDRLDRQNVFSWAAVIGLYCRKGLNVEALFGFIEMQRTGIFPDNFVIPNALKACSALQWVELGMAIHGYSLKMGFDSCVFVGSSLVDMYGKCGVLDDARQVFDTMRERNVVAWNSMLVGYVQNLWNEEAVEIFYRMRIENFEPTRVTIVGFLSASANLEAVEEGRQAHAIAVSCGLELDNILGSALVNYYLKIGFVDDGELVFTRMVEKDVVSWNLLLSGYVQDEHIEKAIDLLHRMQSDGLRPDSVTLSSVLSACTNSGNLDLGKESHGYSIRNNLESDMVVASSIVDMYAKCGRIEDARQVFNYTEEKDLVLWNTLIAGYAQIGFSGEALNLFYQMQLTGLVPNVVSWNSVILGFVRNGQVPEAQDMFSQMQSTGTEPNLITWTTLISGLAQNGHEFEAILLFKQMQALGLRPSSVSLMGVLVACTKLASLQYGRSIHGYYIRRFEFGSSLSVITSIVDMYAKCGSIDIASKVFEMVLIKELPLYNTMISGYALHGRTKEALELFNQMQREGLKPDSITFTGVLSACNHGGLVDEGFKIFYDMVRIYHLTPRMEHYGCVVSLLARSGKLDEALIMISAMPMKPDAHLLGSLLSACREQHEMELGEKLSQILLRLEPQNLGNYVALSNIYAASGRWEDVSGVRNLMREKGWRKDPGYSWIQIGRELHTFVASDRSHPQTTQIFEMLQRLGREVRFIGYVQIVDDIEHVHFKQVT